MRVHVVDVARLETGVLQRDADGADRGLPVLRRCGQMVRITGGAVPDDLAERPRAPCRGAFGGLQDQDAGPFPHQESVPVLREGNRLSGRRHRARVQECRAGETRQRGFGAADDGRVGLAAPDRPHPRADGLGTARTGRRHAVRLAVQAVPNGDLSGRGVGHQHGNGQP